MSQTPPRSPTMSQTPPRSPTMSQSPPPSTTMVKAPLDNGKKTKGRQRRENVLVKNKESRQVTFSKRKTGLWKKVAELVVLCRANIAIVVISEAGKVFAIGSPSADAVLGCVDDAPVPAAAANVNWEALEALFRDLEKKSAEVTAEAARMTAIGKKVQEVKEQTGKQHWWEVDPQALGKEELPVFAKALERLRDNVRRLADDRLSAQ